MSPPLITCKIFISYPPLFLFSGCKSVQAFLTVMDSHSSFRTPSHQHVLWESSSVLGSEGLLTASPHSQVLSSLRFLVLPVFPLLDYDLFEGRDLIQLTFVSHSSSLINIDWFIVKLSGELYKRKITWASSISYWVWSTHREAGGPQKCLPIFWQALNHKSKSMFPQSHII